MSLRIAILRILAARPDGTVPLATVRAELKILMFASSWAGRDNPIVRRNAPPPDLFSSGFVFKDGDNWRISADGRAYLNAYGDGRFALQPNEAAESDQPVEVATEHSTSQTKPLVIISGKDAAAAQRPPAPARIIQARPYQRRTGLANRR